MKRWNRGTKEHGNLILAIHARMTVCQKNRCNILRPDWTFENLLIGDKIHVLPKLQHHLISPFNSNPIAAHYFVKCCMLRISSPIFVRGPQSRVLNIASICIKCHWMGQWPIPCRQTEIKYWHTFQYIKKQSTIKNAAIVGSS